MPNSTDLSRSNLARNVTWRVAINPSQRHDVRAELTRLAMRLPALDPPTAPILNPRERGGKSANAVEGAGADATHEPRVARATQPVPRMSNDAVGHFEGQVLEDQLCDEGMPREKAGVLLDRGAQANIRGEVKGELRLTRIAPRVSKKDTRACRPVATIEDSGVLAAVAVRRRLDALPRRTREVLTFAHVRIGDQLWLGNVVRLGPGPRGPGRPSVLSLRPRHGVVPNHADALLEYIGTTWGTRRDRGVAARSLDPIAALRSLGAALLASAELAYLGKSGSITRRTTWVETRDAVAA